MCAPAPLPIRPTMSVEDHEGSCRKYLSLQNLVPRMSYHVGVRWGPKI